MKIKMLLLATALLAPVAAFAQSDTIGGITTAPRTGNAAPLTGVKNIIVLINDGGGYTVYDATRMWLGRPLRTDERDFKQIGLSTYPLRHDSSENNQPIPGAAGLAQEPGTVFNSASFWDTTPATGLTAAQAAALGSGQFYGPGPAPAIAGGSAVPGYGAYPAAFDGYEFSRFAHPDSGETASAMSDGIKTYNNAINVDGNGLGQYSLVENVVAAHGAGKSTGVVTVVEFGDATPAAFGGAHNIARRNRQEIANEMFSAHKLDVIGGTGNPDYDDDSLPRAVPNYTWISPTLWADLKADTNVSTFNPDHFRLVQDRSDVQAIASGTAAAPAKLAMIVKSFNSSQYNRNGVATNFTSHGVCYYTVPGFQYRSPTVNPGCAYPLKSAVPTQAELTVAALNVLGQNSHGFFLMSEAGAVDRAEHGNSTGRMIEEMVQSQDTVQAIISWVGGHHGTANWDNTILVITADHDHLLYGPNGDTVPFQPLQDKGFGQVPGNKWFGPNHGTGIVPLYAYGKAAAQLTRLGTNRDSYTDAQGRTFGRGLFIDQTVLGQVLNATAAQAN